MFTILGTSFHKASTDPQDMAAAYVARPGRGNFFFFAGI
jgi:putative SOS response-associated peptidase YedK